MRKSLKLLTAIAVVSLIASCGGGGGGGKAGTQNFYNNPVNSSSSSTTSNSSNSSTTSTTSSNTTSSKSGLTVVPENSKAVSVTPSYLFTSGLKPKLVCDEGVFEPDTVSKTEVHFDGNSFTNCTLAFTSADGVVVYTAMNKLTADSGSVVKLNNDLTLTSVSGEVSLNSLSDADNDGITDSFENKTVTAEGVEEITPYNKTVIIVLEGDDMGDSSLTDELKSNYNQLVNGLQESSPANVRFVVIWDGAKKNGLDGNSDVFILDPSTGKTFSVIDSDVNNILSGDSIADYYNDGIRFWYAGSDNISNHLKELIEIASKMYPANSYDLIISDHGDGWVSLPTPTTRTVLFESSKNGESVGTTWLGTKQFVDTVLKPLAKRGIKFDLLGFDECLMGEFATLTLLKDYANVFVASPEYEEADGWGTVWKKLPDWYQTANSTWEIAKKIVDGYVSYYKQNEPECQLCYSTDIGLTAIKSEAIETLRQSFEKFAESLYKTALNEKENGQMYEVFRYYFDNDYLSIADEIVYWGASGGYGEEDNDNIIGQLYYSLDSTSYIGKYGNDGSGSFLGYDLLYLIRNTGIVARAIELGYQFEGDYKVYENGVNQYFSPSFDPLTDDRAVDFVNTYNSTVANDQLYTKYLYIDYDPSTVPEERQGSGLGLIYPYTSPLQADTPKLTLCNYQNFVESYNETLPNYVGFVKTVFEEMWKAVEDSGLADEFTCNPQSGNVEWKQE